MIEEDDDLAVKVCDTDLPGSKDETDRAAGEEENPDAKAR
jgi:hypothetical protein